MQHTFLKFDQSQTNPRFFSIKTQEPQMKQENPRCCGKSPAGATLIVTVCPTKKCVNVTLCIFAQGLVSQTCAALVLTDLSTPHSAVIAQPDVTRTSSNLKQKHIVTLTPGRTDPRISLRRPILIKLISCAA